MNARKFLIIYERLETERFISELSVRVVETCGKFEKFFAAVPSPATVFQS